MENIYKENYVLCVLPCPDNTGESQYCEINTLLNDFDKKKWTLSNKESKLIAYI